MSESHRRHTPDAPETPDSAKPSNLTRRTLLGGAASSLAAVAWASGTPRLAEAAESDPGDPAVQKGRVKQSIVFWCFNMFGGQWDVDTTCQKAKQLGCQSVELVDPADFATLKKHGLTCAIANNGMPAPPFVKGMNNPKYHDEVISRTSEVIDACAAAGFPSTIAFTGYKYRDAEDPSSGEISLEEGMANCVEGFKKLMPHAEEKGVTVNLEMLNTRDDTHDMKGHPGYQGDHIDYCLEIVKQVGSPRLKLLFDIYHVQIMDGDVIRRINEMHEYIGHIHTAGNPGRNELDDTQELNYAPIIQALVDNGYDGYVGQEFIPTGDPMAGLRQAVRTCDV